MHALGHFKTITHHKLLVMGYCFQVGLYRQGLMHDMSKYSWTEFRIGAKYYSGTRSPNAAEREEIGYSTAWLHHKGRNRHHLEYWIDYGGADMELMGHPMPTKYMVELCLDRIAACRVYHGKAYTDKDPLEYLNRSRDSRLMHPETKRQVVEILTMLAEKGQKETFRYLRQVVLRDPVRLYSSKPSKVPPPELKDLTFLNGAPMQALAEELGTPFYLYSQARIREASQALFDAFSWNPGHRQFFPVKAAPTAGILRLLRQLGHGVVCSSGVELELCEKCGFTAREIMFLPNYPRREDVEKAAELGCMVTLDSVDLIDEFGKKGMLKGTVGLRINPGGVFRAGMSEVRLDDVKFGITPQAAAECIPLLRDYGATAIGLHAYLMGNTMEQEYYPKVTEFLCGLAKNLRRDTGMDIAYLNLSGGLGIPYQPGQIPLNLRKIGLDVQQVMQQMLDEIQLDQMAVYTELGRYVTGPAGVLVTRVTHIKHGLRDFAGVDASASDLMRPMMYGAYHHVSVAGKEGTVDRKKWDVVGVVCEGTDKFAENRSLPDLNLGDVLVIHDAGAHGHSMGYNYGGRLRCAEYLLREDGSTEKIRRAETTADYLETMIF